MIIHGNSLPVEEETVAHRTEVLGSSLYRLCLVVNVGVSVRCQRLCIESLLIWLMGLL